MGVVTLKQRLFPKGLRRALRTRYARLVHRTSERDFYRCFRSLSIEPGSTLCVHAAMSGFGYLPQGLPSVFTALQRAVPDCTIMMPTFPFSASALDYVKSGAVFDPRSTPSASGQLSETLRRFPGARRSAHPTHPCVAVGPAAEFLIDGSERSETPFGDTSTYGRFSALPNAVLLLLHTNTTSYVHRLQEMLDWPHLFLPGHFEASGLGADGTLHQSRVRVHRPRLPMYVASPDAGSTAALTYVWYPDFILQFPGAKGAEVEKRLAPDLVNRFRAATAHLAAEGAYRVGRAGPGEVLALSVRPWQEAVIDELKQSLQAYPEAYQLEALERARSEGRL